jgi:hypothetical protein
MDAAEAITSVVDRVGAHGQDYPTANLRADRFEGGWCVYAPEMIADLGPETRSVFLVGNSGRVKELTSSDDVDEARRWFEESCIWFTAEEPGEPPAGLPSHPDLGGASRPRTRTDYDRAAIDVLATALTHERDFADWLSDRLYELGALLGGGSRLIARSPNSWAAGHLTELAQPVADQGGRAEVWRTWPAVDPATLPDVDTTGWLLTPCVAACDFMEDLEPESEAAARVADVIADRSRQAPPWRACGVAELMPQFVLLRRTERLDADLVDVRGLTTERHGEDVLGVLLMSSAGDADVDTLLRIAVDAEQHGREVIDIDVAATAAYRRLLDRLELPFENYAFEAMFE